MAMEYVRPVPVNVELQQIAAYNSTKNELLYMGHYPKLSNSSFAPGFGGNGIIFNIIGQQQGNKK